MVIKWQGAAQHTDVGLVRAGDVIDTTTRGIPDEVATTWIRGGYAAEVKQKKAGPKESGAGKEE